MNKYAFKKAVIDDVIVASTFALQFLEETGIPYVDLRVVNYMVQTINDPDGFCTLATYEDVPVGVWVGYVQTHVFSGTKTATDRLVYVDPGHRNKFVVGGLHRIFLEWAGLKGCNEVIISALYSKDNEKMMNLLRYMGYDNIGYLLRKKL